MKDCEGDPTPNEILYAQEKKLFNSLVQAEYVKILYLKDAGIKEAFAWQREAAAVIFFSLKIYNYISNFYFQEPWDQKRFEKLLTCWIVTCDQPFYEVEKPDFVKMMKYGHHAVPDFSLPKREGVQQCIMKLGKKTINVIKEILAVGFTLIFLIYILISLYFHQLSCFRE